MDWSAVLLQLCGSTFLILLKRPRSWSGAGGLFVPCDSGTVGEGDRRGVSAHSSSFRSLNPGG